MKKSRHTGYRQNEIIEETKVLRERMAVNGASLGDKTLVALRAGDHMAYQDIYLTYKESIQYFLQRLLGSSDEAEELTQAIFVNVWEKRETVDPSRSIKSYLFSIARNSALDFFKHQKVHDRYINNEMYNDGLDYDSDEQMVAYETECLIEIAVSRMPKVRRQVFEMSRYEGLSNDEIAARLNISRETVYSHISNALRDVKEVLAVFSLLFIIN